MASIDPNNLTPDQKRQIVGQCNFFWLSTLSTAAFVCGLTATGYCSFVKRNIVFTSTSAAEQMCEQSGFTSSQCGVMTQNHGVGFFGWQTTVPVNQVVCMSYTQYIPNVGYVTPGFDSNFQMAQVSSFIADVFGGVAFFTLGLSACCPISQARLRALSCHFFIACLFQGFTLLIFQSNVCQKDFFASYFPDSDTSVVESVSCSLDTGSNLAVSATVFYFLCMLTVPKALVPKPIRLGGGLDDDLEDVEK